MRRKNLSLFERRFNYQLSSLFHSQHSQVQKLNSKKNLKKQSSSKDHPQQKSSLSEIKPTQKSNTNTVFSSRLFEKAHRLESHKLETYLPSKRQAKSSNESKMKNVYQTYVTRKYGFRRSIELQQSKQNQLSLSERKLLGGEVSVQKPNRKQPYISSLTKIIMNQCQVPFEEDSELNTSYWIQILCEAEQNEPSKKKSEKNDVTSPPENPYQLLPLRKKRDLREGRPLLCAKIQKKIA